MNFQIKLEMFEGPFDLLLNLISKQEIDIYQVSISKITQEYLDYINKIKELNLDLASEFLLIAAILLDLKASRLIPKDKQEVIVELSAEEVRNNLINRLIEYKKFKDLADELETKIDENRCFYPRCAELEERFVKFIPDFTGKIKPDKMAASFVEILRLKAINLIDASHITPIPISVDDQIKYVVKRLSGKKKQSFYELTKDFKTKHEVIATFLALLELYKRKIIMVSQAEVFAEIETELVASDCHAKGVN
ncbi:MAG: segregation/condensation protein A [Actinobacteria bacterium]|nr:MAG: segregation/condensation protein A [Actinomycetota bacterium]